MSEAIKTAGIQPSPDDGIDPNIARAHRKAYLERERTIASARSRGDRIVAGHLPDGARLHRKAQNVQLGGGNSGNLYTAPIPYNYPHESPEREWFPKTRKIQVDLGRRVAAEDALVPTCIDILTELPFSEFDLKGPGVTGSIKRGFEDMVDRTGLVTKCTEGLREYFITGEMGAHGLWDATDGMWRKFHFHPSDQLTVYDLPVFMQEPIVEWTPPDHYREILAVDHPMMRKQRGSIPRDVLEAVLNGDSITLEPAAFTLLARKNAPDAARGTSILTRIWRAIVYQDALFHAAIQTARRMAAPVKLVKLGDPGSDYYPTPEQERAIKEALAQSELDPGAWITWSWAINVELIGVQERVLPITQHMPLVEAMILSAFGINKALILGEASYNSASAGLTIILQRLLALRNMLVRKWLVPKVFGMMAVANNWVLRSPAEVQHGLRINRSPQETRYIIPDIVWRKSLDSNIDSEKISAIGQLKEIGARYSQKTLHTLSGTDFEEETKNILGETKYRMQMAGNDPALISALGGGEEAGPGGGGGGMGGAPPIAPGVGGDPGGAPPDAGGGPPPAGGGEVPAGDAGSAAGPGEAPGAMAEAPNGRPNPTNPKPDTADGKEAPDTYAGWPKEFVDAGVRLFSTFDPEEARDVAPWDEVLADKAVKAALAGGDGAELWDEVETALADRDVPPQAIAAIANTLASRARMISRATLASRHAGQGKGTQNASNSVTALNDARKAAGFLNKKAVEAEISSLERGAGVDLYTGFSD